MGEFASDEPIMGVTGRDPNPFQSCPVILDISGNPIEFQWGSQKYPG